MAYLIGNEKSASVYECFPFIRPYNAHLAEVSQMSDLPTVQVGPQRLFTAAVLFSGPSANTLMPLFGLYEWLVVQILCKLRIPDRQIEPNYTR